MGRIGGEKEIMLEFWIDLFSDIFEEYRTEIFVSLKYIGRRFCCNLIADAIYNKVKTFFQKAKNHSNANKSGFNN